MAIRVIYFMERFFHRELEDFRSTIFIMGEKAVAMVRMAANALEDGDLDIAKRVLAKDDEIDALEVAIDNEAYRYISLRNPVGSELRLLSVGMKVGHNLERIGDEATSIARRVKKLGELMPVPNTFDVLPMASDVAEMLRDSVDCFLSHNRETAVGICTRDKAIDNTNKANYTHFAELIQSQPETTMGALEWIFISKSLERIGDHATNIAEEMIFLSSGEDVRHSEELKELKHG